MLDVASTRMLRELHEWHQPRVDPETGQPRFFWYGEPKLQDELRKNRESMQAVEKALQKVHSTMKELIRAMGDNDKVKAEGD